jgi:hypothetical protein
MVNDVVVENVQNCCSIDGSLCDHIVDGHFGACFCFDETGKRINICPRFDVKKARGMLLDAFLGKYDPVLEPDNFG